MKPYKFQALVTLCPPGSGGHEAVRPGPTRRLVVRARHHETHRSKLFSALITTNDGSPLQPGNDDMIVTMLLLGDDAGNYLGPGDHFTLWLGSDIGHGIVSRRMFSWPFT
jgi:hypothetical protein